VFLFFFFSFACFFFFFLSFGEVLPSLLDNPALISSFVNQYNVFRSRKKNDPEQFFKMSYKNSPEKLWVMGHFDRYADKYSWNEDLVNIVPIVPALHGSDFAVAGM
jgi:hypothetical protein